MMSARPTLILLPGLDGTGALYAAFAAVMHRHEVRTLVVEYPRDRVMEYGALAHWLTPQLREAGPCVLLGESFAGPLVALLAADATLDVRGVVLSTTFARRPVALSSKLAGMLRLPLPAPPVGLLSRLLFGRWHTRDRQRALSAALEGVPLQVLRHRAIQTLQVDVRVAMAALAVPVLCLHATHDHLLRAEATRELLDVLPPRAQVHRMEGPHLLLQVEAGSAGKAVAAWFDSLASHGG